MAELGTPSRPVRIAIIGAGPAGFYAAGALIGKKQEIPVSIDLFDRLPAPYGLVRYGVAPDHEKIKNVRRVYKRTAEDDRVRFFGNVNFGTDLTHADLKAHYDQIVYAVGAQSDRRLGIPGEDLPGSMSATAFVAWYNGHPDYVDLNPNLDIESVAVIGVGNVAMDVARILAKSTEELAGTDIADHALEQLQHSKVRNIYVLGRRGPVQAKFTNPEIREFGQLEIADAIVDPAQLELDAHSAAAMEGDRMATKNVQILQEIIDQGTAGKQRAVHFRFLVSPTEIQGDEAAGVTGIQIQKNELRPTDSGYLQAYGTGEMETLPVRMVLRSVGYRGVPLPDVPFDERRGTIPNAGGRISDPVSGEPVAGEYVVGWAKRGPSGVIGTNKADAVATVQLMLEDIPSTQPVAAEQADPQAIADLLAARDIRYISFETWKQLSAIEEERGQAQGRPRVKFVDVEEMLTHV